MLDSLLLVPRNRATRLLTARFDDLKTDTSKDRASRLRAIIALSHNFLGLRDLRRIIEHSAALRELIVENGVMGELAFRPALHHAHFSVADERAFAIAPDMRSLRIERWGGMLCHSRPADEIHVAPQAAARIRSLSISFRWCDGVGETAPLIGILASLPSLEVRLRCTWPPLTTSRSRCWTSVRAEEPRTRSDGPDVEEEHRKRPRAISQEIPMLAGRATSPLRQLTLGLLQDRPEIDERHLPAALAAIPSTLRQLAVITSTSDKTSSTVSLGCCHRMLSAQVIFTVGMAQQLWDRPMWPELRRITIAPCESVQAAVDPLLLVCRARGLALDVRAP